MRFSPSGTGLTYTHFTYGKVSLSQSRVSLREANREDAYKLVTATATVTNSGERAATEIVQCYVRNLGASVEQPVRSLQGFARVTLKPGESKQVSFDLGFPELSFYNVENKAVIEPTNYTVWIGGSSLATDEASFDVRWSASIWSASIEGPTSSPSGVGSRAWTCWMGSANSSLLPQFSEAIRRPESRSQPRLVSIWLAATARRTSLRAI